MKNMIWKNVVSFAAGIFVFLLVAAVSIPNAPHRQYLAGLAADYLYKLDGSFGFYVQDVINHLLSTSNPHSVTAAQTGAVDANTAITGATKTKITYDDKGLVTAGTDATTADIADSTDKRYVTDAQQTVIVNTSGTNTGDETAARIGAIIAGANEKLIPADADNICFTDSDLSHILVKQTLQQFKAALKAYLDAYYADGTVTSVSVTTANGVSGSVATETTTPAITLTLGDITPTKINGMTVGRGGGDIASNTAVGVDVLSANVVGDYNTAVGNGALSANTGGDYNSALGYQSLYSNSTQGNYNTAMGGQALYGNTAGDNNTAIGYQALYSNNTGGCNVALGNSAGKHATGNYEFYLDILDRTNNANEKTNSLLYGQFNSDPASQTLKTNAAFTATYGINIPTGQTYKINNVALTTADIADSTDKRYVTDAQQTVIVNTSGTNTGDQTNIPGNAATATKATNIAGGNSTTGRGSLPYQSDVDTTTLLAPNVTAIKKFLTQTGDGTNGAIPAWEEITKTTVGLPNVENTALSTWAGTANITTLGTVTSGTLGDGSTIVTPTMSLGADADGDMYYRSSGKLTRLAKGAATKVLAMNSGGTAPEWVSAGGLTRGNGSIYANGMVYGKAGLTVGAYLGNATARDISLGFSPHFFGTKSITAVQGILWTYYGMSKGSAVVNTVNDVIKVADDNLGIRLGATAGANTNAAGYNYFAMCAHDGTLTGMKSQVGTYTGNGTAATFGISFSPNILIIKGAGAQSAVFRTSDETYTSGTECDYFLIATASLASGGIETSLGQTVITGANAAVNTNGVTYQWIALKSDAAGTSDFALTSYTGVAGTGVHVELPFQPNILFLIPATALAPLMWTSSMPAGNTAYISAATANVTDAVITADAYGFTIGASAAINAPGVVVNVIAIKTDN